MSTNVAINGMGRIRRMILRIALQNRDLNVVAISASCPSETIAHLINYDATHGKYNLKVEPIENGLQVGDHGVRLVVDRNPGNLPWKRLDIDIVIDAAGKLSHGDRAITHIKAGAKKVLLTGPSKGGRVQVVVKGVNNNQLDIEAFDILSSAPCTTNCVGPVAKVLNNQFGIVSGLMTTVHAITNDQKDIDNPHKDLGRTCSCNENIIPASAGAAKTLKGVLPELEGELHGMALHVPTRNVSLVDLVVDLEKEVTTEEINQAFENADLEGVIEVEHQPLVSVDLNTNPNSTIIGVKSTIVTSGSKVKVIAWYDNEWGCSNRVVDVAEQVGALLTPKETVSAGQYS